MPMIVSYNSAGGGTTNPSAGVAPVTGYNYDYKINWNPLGSDLESKLRENLAANGAQYNPMYNLMRGEATDRLSSQYAGTQQGIADRFAGWNRGSGLMQSALKSADEEQRARMADMTRQYMIQQMATEGQQKQTDITNAMNFTQMDLARMKAIQDALMGQSTAGSNATNQAALMNAQFANQIAIAGMRGQSSSGMGFSNTPTMGNESYYNTIPAGTMGTNSPAFYQDIAGKMWNTPEQAMAASGRIQGGTQTLTGAYATPYMQSGGGGGGGGGGGQPSLYQQMVANDPYYVREHGIFNKEFGKRTVNPWSVI